jgi:hypothetical protein
MYFSNLYHFNIRNQKYIFMCIYEYYMCFTFVTYIAMILIGLIGLMKPILFHITWHCYTDKVICLSVHYFMKFAYYFSGSLGARSCLK